MEQHLYDLADRLTALRAEKDEADKRLKSINAKVRRLEHEMAVVMENGKVQSINRAGFTFYRLDNLQVSPLSGQSDTLYAALRQAGYGDLVKETVHSKRLQSFVKEQKAENDNVLPDWLSGLVNVYDEKTVGVRKASKLRSK